MVGREKKTIFNGLKERVAHRIQGWKERLLSKAGHEILIKSVAQSIPTYTMSYFKVPKVGVRISRLWKRIIGGVDTDGKILSSFYYFPRYRPPFGECVCDLYLFPASRYELCVCGNLCTCVRVSTNLESPPTMGNFKV